MTLSLTIAELVWVLGFVLSLMAGSMLFYRVGKKHSARWLAFAYLFIGISLFVCFLLKTGGIQQATYLYGVGTIFYLLYLPAGYLYFRFVTTQKGIQKNDWLHALPVVLYIIDYTPFFLSSPSYKISLLNTPDVWKHVVNHSSGWLFQPGFYYVSWIVVSTIYWLASFILFTSYRNASAQKEAQMMWWTNWAKMYLSLQLLVLISAPTFLVLKHYSYFFLMASIVAGINAAVTICVLFLKPDVLCGRPVDNSIGNVAFEDNHRRAMVENQTNDYPKKPKSLQYLSHKQIRDLRKGIDDLLQCQRPYLKHGYTIQQMSESLSLPLYQLSALINQEYKMNFNDLINQHRIQYAIQFIKNGRGNKFNLSGLADKCGFSNRNTFSTAFKKFIGTTPSQYFKDIE